MRKKITVFLVLFIFLFSISTPALSAAKELMKDESKVSVVTVEENKDTLLQVSSAVKDPSWQILYKKTWVDILDAGEKECRVNYAMAKNMLDREHSCSIRCIDAEKKVQLQKKIRFVGSNIQKDTLKSEYKVLQKETVSDGKTEETVSNKKNAANMRAYRAGTKKSAQSSGLYLVKVEYYNEQGNLLMQPWTKVFTKETPNQTIHFPVVQGYEPYLGCSYNMQTEGWEGGTRQDTQTFSYSELETMGQDLVVNVIYKPAQVLYTVNRHYQNEFSSDYYVVAETQKGYSGQTVDVKALAGTKTGFSAMWFDEPKIAPNGSTVVDIYYDRLYYLLNFDLDGGYGTEPIYARYGSNIQVPEPKRAGYVFKGWTKVTEGQTAPNTPVALPTTMPAENSLYRAIWEESKMAKVTVEIWGEKPNGTEGDRYDYIRSFQEEGTVGEKLDLSGATTPICGKTEHVHDKTCYKYKISSTIFGRPQYKQCLRNLAFWDPDKHPENYGDGDIYRHLDGQVCKWSAKDEKWYECANVSCNKEEHQHTDTCFGNYLGTDLWEFDSVKTNSENPTIKADGSTVVHVYYKRKTFEVHFRHLQRREDLAVISAKWGDDVEKRVQDIVKTTGITKWGERPNGARPWFSSLRIMPKRNLIVYGEKSTGNQQTAQYYGQTIGGDANDLTKGYELMYTNTINDSTDLEYSSEARIQFEGYSFKQEIPGTKTGFGNGGKQFFDGAKLYYVRNSYNLDFINGSTTTTVAVPFGDTLSKYKPTPDQDSKLQPPAGLEPGAYTFDGWYEDAGFVKPFPWENLTMPAANKAVYAKWKPVTRNVTTYDNEEDMKNGKVLGTYSCKHGEKVTLTRPDHSQYKLKFLGWFYYDEYGKETAFDDRNMTVKRDLKLYAKYTSDIMVSFKVHYALKGTGTEIAPPVEGKIMGGVKKTFFPKAGTELNAGYQAKYYPTEVVQSVNMNVDPNTVNEVWFYYEYAEPPIPYKVQYLELGTQKELKPDKVNEKNMDAKVEEKFAPITGYLPDAHTKTLYVTPDTKKNVITFWYTKDSSNRAPIRYTQWIQKADLSGYEIYSDEPARYEEIGKNCEIPILTIPGFEENTKPHDEAANHGVLTEKGLHLQRFYDRISYPYEIDYLEEGTHERIQDPDGLGTIQPEKGNRALGTEVVCNSQKIRGWRCINPGEHKMKIAIEESRTEAKNNRYVFYYKKVQDKNSLTIETEAMDPFASNQTFLYEVKTRQNDKGPITVAIKGNASVTIRDLPEGIYEIRQKNGWNWRYSLGKEVELIDVSQDSKIILKPARINGSWLSHMAYLENNFAQTP